jgi:hypothetical protein
VDVAIFRGQQDEYRFELADDGALLVFDTEPGRDGTDRLYGIERLGFADGELGTQQAMSTLIA